MKPLRQTAKQTLAATVRGHCFVLLFLGLLVFGPTLRGQEQTQFWPEADTYVDLSSRTRLEFITKLDSDPQTGNLQGEFGPNFDFYFRPFLRPSLRDLDPAKSKLLTFRIGYLYFPPLRGDAPVENRPLTELTARFHWPLAMLLSDRSREEFRFISGKSFSRRYRNRVTLERNFTIRRYLFTPYVRDEIFYSHHELSANALTVGSIFPTSRHTEMEGYYKIQENLTRGSYSYIRGAGVILSLYL